MTLSVREIDTPQGPARVHVERPARGASLRGSLVLSHGAGGGVQAGDLVALRALVDDGWTYVRVEQPWRVAGRRVATPPRTLDAAWVPVLAALCRGRWALPWPLVVGGRSAGARVACRTATGVGADAVLALSFPLVPPSGGPSRDHEARLVLDAGLPLAVVQGLRDPFGTPDDVRRALGEAAAVYAVRGDHSLGRHPEDVLVAADQWLSTLTQ
ncbi:alpha/beta family hydrolase [Allobranchiibius huperziae]|uniref:KANL3/Tex30 alpha/beta hydrolase-like domain-containing protein n=1 Tax=Allobranchiibius huperziae TaxID=1874116 RepID=A0A853DFR7_9MICO|nr:alpha/beta family hydrolase [Allobranchiibius huperziae]NYJ73904.1 hypothetical protein [Allobranchiibius huperziae]